LYVERTTLSRCVLKSRPPHACFECSLYYQVSFDWTTSFLSDAPIIRRVVETVNRLRIRYWLSVKLTSICVITSTGSPFNSVGL